MMDLQEKYNKLTLTLDEAASELGVDVSDIIHIIKRGELSVKIIGSKEVIPIVDMARYLNYSVHIKQDCKAQENFYRATKRITVKNYLDNNLLSFYPKASDRTKQSYVSAAKRVSNLIGNYYLDELNRGILQLL